VLPPPELLRRALLRLLLTALAAAAIALAWHDALLQAALPLLRAGVAALDTNYRTVELSIRTIDGESVIERVATPSRVREIGGHVIFPDEQSRLSTRASAGILLQPAILGAALLAGWPWRRWRELALRCLFAMPLLALVMILDVPMMLVGFVWFEEVKALDPDRFVPMVTWADFMNAGGRFVLTVAAVVVAVAAARRLLERADRRAAITARG